MAKKATIDHSESTGRDGAIDHISKLFQGAPATWKGRMLYADAGGSIWHLITDEAGPAVLHAPNFSSGAQVNRLEIAEFLASGDRPEQQALLRLISSLVDDTQSKT